MSDMTRERTVEDSRIDSDRFHDRFGVFGGSSRRGTDVVTGATAFLRATFQKVAE